VVVLDYISYKNEPNDLVRGLFSSIDIGKYIPPNYRPLSTFLGPFEDAPKPRNNIKNQFLVVLDYF
jgi:hypothetical protein